MDTNKLNLKNNLIKLAVFFAVALLSILLIMMAVTMLDLNSSDDTGGVENKSASIDNEDIDKHHEDEDAGDQDLEQKQDNHNEQGDTEEQAENLEDESGLEDQSGDIEEQISDWQEQAKEKKEDAFNPSVEEDYATGDQNESLLPDAGEFDDDFFEDTPNIDMSGRQDLPDDLYGKDSSGKSIHASEEKSGHVPVFEVLGKPNYPFLKVMVMENYHKNRWIVDKEEEPELKLMIGVEKQREFSENSVKIKPIEPSKGNLPVLSGNIELKYDYNLLKYEDSGTYFAEDVVDSFYEMVYQTPPTKGQLENAKTDRSYYELSYSTELEGILDTVIENSNSDYEAIKFVEEYLSQNYVLDNSVINDYGDNDGINSFLFGEGKVGNSLDFLSSYTFILRAIGIPCRLAVGYRIDDTKPYQIVYGDQRYIYPEIKFEEFGWVPMDVFASYPFYTPPESTETEITHADPIAKRGTSFNVKGTVKDSHGNLLDGLQVLIYVKEDKENPYLSYAKANVENGYFEIECEVKDITTPGNYHVIAELLEDDTYRTSSSDPDLKVVTDTYLELNSKNTITGVKFDLEGRILDEYSKEGLEGFPIHVAFESIDLFEETHSIKDGIFRKEIEIDITDTLSPDKNLLFAKKYLLPYEVKFNGTDFYYPSSAKENLVVWKLMPAGIIGGIILLLFLLAAIILLFIKMKKVLFLRKAQLVPAGVGNDFNLTSNNNFLINKQKKTQKLFIEFPFIKENLPNVWGVEDELLIRFTDDKGNGSEKRAVFHKKGKYRINISGNNIFPVSRQINIVIYREEVISLGKRFLKDVLNEDFEISSTLTLREVYHSLKSKVLDKKYKVLGRIFVVLEKAVYSEEVVDRNDYEMFLTMLENYKSM
ncbi:transglutaminase domain-containing protein [Herbivorax sp. ANBcel31]|uniref:transglutaminase domain-containing protein n=1 Tax=Herbivorax sp. ANBcel31 TaxID=3069754 RepID=UPI0027B29A4B|nr:transglutaminase domain-containing protein [Herbivorax sp. ANBcel31]MDQ2087874.1 transglutaminase domain-containing protein [Herbivorax sp. ANBcel31]